MATDSKWRKELGFLEGLMFDPVTSGILGAAQGLMGLFQTSEQNSKIDDAIESYKDMRFTEDQMARRGSDVKRMYGSMVDSMIGAGQYLNSDTARALQNAKLTGQSLEAQMKQRMSDEQRNLQIDEQITKLEGSKQGYLGGIAGILSGGLQGIFNATQLGMAMDSKEKEQDMIDQYMNPDKYKNQPVISSLTGEEIPQVNAEVSGQLKTDLLNYGKTELKKNFDNLLTDDMESKYEKDRINLANYIAQISKAYEDLYSINYSSPIFNKNSSPVYNSNFQQDIVQPEVVDIPKLIQSDFNSLLPNFFPKRLQSKPRRRF